MASARVNASGAAPAVGAIALKTAWILDAIRAVNESQIAIVMEVIRELVSLVSGVETQEGELGEEEIAPGATADVELDAELDAEVLRREVPLLRAAAKYLLTACDRLRRGAVREAWTYRTSNPELAKGAIADAKLWDKIMRELSSQLGVLHPLNELVTPLPIGEGELSELGLPYSQLLNGEDLLAL